jgi:AcrR family transcriptional regulator
MPKIVNAEQRRHEVVQAVYRVIRRDGLDKASLRNIADEAGLAIGSVRHYFADHAEVMTFAMKELSEQTGQRVRQHVHRLLNPSPQLNRRQAVLDLLTEFLPLDEQRRLETTVWLAFVAAARTRPPLQPYAERVYDGFRMILRRLLSHLTAAGKLTEPIDLDVETERLAALLDGLTMNGVLQPDRFDDQLARAVLGRHLDSLTTAATTS